MAHPVETDWEAEYNVRLRHPDRQDVYEQCLEASAAAYRTLASERDVRYGAGDRARIDYFPARRVAHGMRAAAVAFFHGGYWHSHDRSEFALIAEPFVHAGVAVALVGYDLAPANPVRAIVAQARLACRWLRAHATELRFDPHALLAAGHSAGAHLAACVLTDPDHVVRGGLLVSGIFDLEPLCRTSFARRLGLTPAEARDLSPLRHAFPPRGDVLVVVGEQESAQFVYQSRRFAQAWAATRRSSQLAVVPELHHYSIVLALGRKESRLARMAVEWARAVTRRASGTRPRGNA